MSKRLAEERTRKIDEMLQKLTSSDPAERKAAVLYLGEAAAGDAVESLVDVYENDEDRGVRKAAAYALGMFKAIDKEISRSEKSKARVIKLLDQVENQGRLGKRANRSGLFSSILLLLVMLALLIGLNIAWQNADVRGAVLVRVGAITVTPNLTRPMAYQIDQQFQRIRADLTTLQTQYESIRAGGVIDCTAFFNNPTALPPENFVTSAELGAIAASLNSVLVDLITSRSRFDAACGPQAAPLTAAEIDQALPALTSAQTRLNEIERQFAPYRAFVPTATPIPTATPDPNITPSPTVAVADPVRHLNALYELADQMTRPNGGAAILQSYWQDVQRTGSTDGCRGRVPNIPDDYVLPQVDREASQELANAVDLINSGLATIRTAWIDFTFACNSQNLSGALSKGLRDTQTALAAFQAAIPYLDAVRDGG